MIYGDCMRGIALAENAAQQKLAAINMLLPFAVLAAVAA
jgi:hypothetical protein